MAWCHLKKVKGKKMNPVTHTLKSEVAVLHMTEENSCYLHAIINSICHQMT